MQFKPTCLAILNEGGETDMTSNCLVSAEDSEEDGLDGYLLVIALVAFQQTRCARTCFEVPVHSLGDWPRTLEVDR